MRGWISRDAGGANNSWRGFVIVVMLVRHRMQLLRRSVNGLTPEVQPPINERAIVLVQIGIFDDDRPCTDAFLTPRPGQRTITEDLVKTYQ